MPEFYLDVHDDYGRWKRLDSFTQGYVSALFFTEMEHGTVHGVDQADTRERLWEPESMSSLPGDMTFADLSQTALASIVAVCAEFQEANAALLARAVSEHGYGLSGDANASELAGTDFWYSRNGHGCGYWDRGLGEVGDALHKAAKVYGCSDVYLGDDDMVHVS